MHMLFIHVTYNPYCRVYVFVSGTFCTAIRWNLSRWPYGRYAAISISLSVYIYRLCSYNYCLYMYTHARTQTHICVKRTSAYKYCVCVIYMSYYFCITTLYISHRLIGVNLLELGLLSGGFPFNVRQFSMCVWFSTYETVKMFVIRLFLRFGKGSESIFVQ